LPASTLQDLGQDLYPWVSRHQRDIDEHFDGRPLRELAQHERDSLGQIDLFLLAFSNRSGSTLLSGILNQAGLPIPPRAEVFNSDSVIPVCIENSTPSFTDYFLAVTTGWAQGGRVGFKIGPRQMFWLARAGLLSHFRSLRIVNSRRRDRVAQAVSFHIAARTGRWHSDMEGTAPVGDVPYVAAEILERLQTIHIDQYLVSYFADVHGVSLVEVFYEDLVDAPDRELARVLDFIGITAADVAAVDLAALGIRRQGTDLNGDFAAQFRADFRHLA